MAAAARASIDAVVHLDTSALIDALTGPRRLAVEVGRLQRAGEPVVITTLVLYEFIRGPRSNDEIEDLKRAFRPDVILPFGVPEARMAARLYRIVARPRTREIDIAIAACAIVHDAALWTLNPRDFADIPGLRLVQ